MSIIDLRNCCSRIESRITNEAYYPAYYRCDADTLEKQFECLYYARGLNLLCCFNFDSSGGPTDCCQCSEAITLTLVDT